MVRISSIPNPKKVFTVQKNVDFIKSLFPKITPYLNMSIKSGHIQHRLDNTIGELEIHKTEFLSLGVKILINANYKEAELTEISIEIQRQVGTFDQSHEVSQANTHLTNIVKAISYLIDNPNVDIIEPKSEEIEPGSKKMGVTGWLIVGAVWIVIGFVIFKFLIK